MSMSFFLILSLETPLDTDTINKDLSSGHDIVLEAGIDLQKHTGYLPIKIQGKSFGLETYYIPIEEIIPILPDKPTVKKDKHFALQLRWGGNINESITAIHTAIAFTSTYNGMVLDPTTQAYISDSDLAIGLEHLNYEL